MEQPGVGLVQPALVVLSSVYGPNSLLVEVLAFRPVTLLVVAHVVAAGQHPVLLVEVPAVTVADIQ